MKFKISKEIEGLTAINRDKLSVSDKAHAELVASREALTKEVIKELVDNHWLKGRPIEEIKQEYGGKLTISVSAFCNNSSTMLHKVIKYLDEADSAIRNEWLEFYQPYNDWLFIKIDYFHVYFDLPETKLKDFFLLIQPSFGVLKERVESLKDRTKRLNMDIADINKELSFISELEKLSVSDSEKYIAED